jgi:hypothetical protein
LFTDGIDVCFWQPNALALSVAAPPIGNRTRVRDLQRIAVRLERFSDARMCLDDLSQPHYKCTFPAAFDL